MAELTIEEQLQETKNQLIEAKGQLEIFKNQALQSEGVVEGLSEQFQKFGLNVSKVKDSLKNAFTSLGETEEHLNRNADALSGYENESLKTVLALDRLTTQFIKTSNTFEEFSSIGSNVFNSMSKQFDELQAKLPSLPAALQEPMKKMLDLAKTNVAYADSQTKLEQGYVGLLGSTGQLSKAFQDAGGSMSGISNMSQQFAMQINDIAAATGQAPKEIAKFTSEMGKIPGALTENVQVSRVSAESINAIEAALKLASGTGRDFRDVAKDVDDAVVNLGEGMQGALEYTSLMSELSNTLGIRFEEVHDVMKNVSSDFKFVGNNAEASANILNKYTQALMNTGISSKAALEIGQGLIKNFNGLSIAQKAFLSGQSGGPGGLQGAYKIEQMLRQGKMDEVMTMMEKQLKKQFGGRIVSLDDAAKDSQSAAQFTKQMAFLKQGPFGKMIDSDAQGYRLLEAMKSGTPDKTQALREPMDALGERVEQGTEIQKSQATYMQAANVFLDRIAQSNQLMAANALRELSTAASSDPRIADYLNKVMTRGSEGANTYEDRFNKGEDDAVKQHLGKSASMLGELGLQTPKVASKGASMFGDLMSDFKSLLMPKDDKNKDFKLPSKNNESVEVKITNDKNKDVSSPKLPNLNTKEKDILPSIQPFKINIPTKEDKRESTSLYNLPSLSKQISTDSPKEMDSTKKNDMKDNSMLSNISSFIPFPQGIEVFSNASKLFSDAVLNVKNQEDPTAKVTNTIANNDKESKNNKDVKEKKDKLDVNVIGKIEGICMECGTKKEAILRNIDGTRIS